MAEEEEEGVRSRAVQRLRGRREASLLAPPQNSVLSHNVTSSTTPTSASPLLSGALHDPLNSSTLGRRRSRASLGSMRHSVSSTASATENLPTGSVVLNKKALDVHTKRQQIQGELAALTQNLEEVTYTAEKQTKDGAGGLLMRENSKSWQTAGMKTSNEANAPEEQSSSQELLDKLLPVHEKVMCVLISLNCITMGVEMDYSWDGWYWFNQAMLIAYLVDIGVRLYAQSCRDFIRGGWNWLDCLIVSSSILDMWIIPIVAIQEHGARKSMIGSITVVLRLPRLLRVFRVLQVVKSVRPLFNLLVGLSEAFSAIFWFLVLVCVLLYGFALIFHQMFKGGWNSLSEDAEESAKEVFSSVQKSFFALFRVMAADMTDLGPILSECNDWVLPILYVFFILCGSWLLLSVLTATVIDNVLASNTKREREEEFNRLQVEREQVTEGLQDALGELANVYDEIHAEDLRQFLESEDGSVALKKLVNKEPFEVMQLWEMLQIEGTVQLDDFIEHLQNSSNNLNLTGNLHRLESRTLRLQRSMDQVLAFLPMIRTITEHTLQETLLSRDATESLTLGGMGAFGDSRFSMGDEELGRIHDSIGEVPRIVTSPPPQSRSSSSSRSPSQKEKQKEAKDSPAGSVVEHEPILARRAAVTHQTMMSPRAFASPRCANGPSLLMPNASPRPSSRSSCRSSARISCVPRSPKASPRESRLPAAAGTEQSSAPSDKAKLVELQDGLGVLRQELNDKVDDLRQNLLDALKTRFEVGASPSQPRTPKSPNATRSEVEGLRGEVVNLQQSLSSSIAKAIREGLASQVVATTALATSSSTEAVHILESASSGPALRLPISRREQADASTGVQREATGESHGDAAGGVSERAVQDTLRPSSSAVPARQSRSPEQRAQPAADLTRGRSPAQHSPARDSPANS